MIEKENQNLTRLPQPGAEATGGQVVRPPVVVVLGHVDHGKSSLLETIKELGVKITEKESGGITQHIGAYQIEKNGKKITFIDTPGHEAFSQMRSRGAKVADIAILVVAADEGVKNQTREAILHIKKAGLSMIVALNKMDKPGSNPEKVKRELQKEEVLVESMGGKIPTVETSAKTGQGIEELLELILIVAEMENLKADLSKPAQGVVIESYLNSKRGPTATLILNEGILKLGDILATHSTLGKIKNLEDFRGERIEKVYPSQPAIVIGFEKVPKFGENFQTFLDLEEAKKYLKVVERRQPEVLEIKPGEIVLNLIIKADVFGSVEAIEEVLKGLPKPPHLPVGGGGKDKPSTKAELGAGPVPHRNEVSGAGIILRILNSEVGEINENNIKLAKSGKALILGFRVKTNSIAKNLAQKEKIKIMNFEVIYDLVEGVRKYMEKASEPKITKEEIGRVKVLVNFWSEKNRQIIGGRIIKGEVKKGVLIEILRENEEKIGQGKLINLQKNKKDIERALEGEEIGVLYEGEGKIEVGDVLVIWARERKKERLNNVTTNSKN